MPELTSPDDRTASSALGAAGDPPWLALPREVSDVIRPFVPQVVDAIIDVVPRQVPAYARPTGASYGIGLHPGVTAALERFLALPGTTLPALSDENREILAVLGSGEFHQGRSMDALLGAYRMAARVTFRELSRISVQQGLGLAVVVNLGESILAYIDELSAVSAAAYANAQSERAGQVDRRRTALLDLLLQGRADEGAVRRAAAIADWVLPQRLAVVTVPRERADGLRLRLGLAALVVDRETEVIALVPAWQAGAERARLGVALRGRHAVVGPAVGWDRAKDSLRMAVLAAAAFLERDGPDDPPLWADEHLARIVLGSEPTVIAEVASRRLAPLAGLRPAQRERLSETLRSHLRHWGQRAPMAAELGIHPQTVGYRVAQLRELFGDTLEDPQVRFELELALEAGHR